MLGYLYGKRFGSNIASANWKEGDKAQARPIFEPDIFPHKFSNISQTQVILGPSL